MSTNLSKEQLRRKFLNWRRSELSEEARDAKSETINEHLKKYLEKRRCSVCLLYYPFDGEVKLIQITQYLIDGDREIALPKIRSDETELDLYKLADAEGLLQSMRDGVATRLLQTGNYGIKEPVSDLNNYLEPIDVDVAFIPGVAFDYTLGRLGYGNGYYDRLLDRFPDSTITIGVAFDEQISSESLPMKEHDHRVDVLATEEGIIEKDGR